MTRPTRVHRLNVTYPEGCDQLGWRPPGWHDKHCTDWVTSTPCTWDPGQNCCDYEDGERENGLSHRIDAEGRFVWPKERQFFSKRAAESRAELLRSWGADADVVSSNPVTWPESALGETGGAAS
ncbi:hypothetical protein ETD86_30045 [Nonomuraea turkmeniaca]|uniref:Uncharacterized protein n=1 Tax=Nonomuraea turkmeniaca TaxID=103838 RepID=A0A5S4F9P1_9ACTN|nr:hypothetical protein [Nonomuraea turkmeniaca]TMR13808.1 hypothetical protein ETD86_30045 [Nonomuraea turkmeniaca]